MKLLDERGIGTVWSICKEKFALAGHTHNYAGSGSPGGSANSAIGVVDYNQTGKTIQIGYSGTGIAGDQIKYIAGYTDGSGNVNAKIKDVSKDALRSWLGLGSLAYSSSSIPTNLSQLNNDKGFVTGSVSGNTITINGASTTWTNTWRGIQDNLTSTSTYESLSANQGRVLKGLVDGKANFSHTHNYLPLSGGTLTGDLLFSNSGTTFRQIQGTCGDNDFWRIGGGATGSNAGYMEIATADDGTEPIYVRQYSGVFSTITRTATLLDDSGNTSFPGTVAAAKFKGALEGNASTASNAATVNGHTVNANVPANAKFTDTNTWRGIQDNLTSTSTSDSLSANQGRILKGLVDSKANSNEVIKSVSVQLYGDTISGFTPNIVVTDNANQEQSFTINKASGNTNGLMSIKDKNKLDLIPDNLSDLCKFNFINSISECRSDRINFILRYHGSGINLDPFDSYPDGTILLITNDYGLTSIAHQSGRWYSNGDIMEVNYTRDTYSEEINLITKNNGTVHHYSFAK